MDTARFRTLLRNQAGAVAVISVGLPGNRTGLTATAVCSLSDNPPTILVCINKNASAHDPIGHAQAFGVSFLSAEQQQVAAVFSGQTEAQGEARFAITGPWRQLTTGSPILADAVASLDCRVVEEHSYSTHTIYIGAVEDGAVSEEADPLLYFRGGFRAIA